MGLGIPVGFPRNGGRVHDLSCDWGKKLMGGGGMGIIMTIDWVFACKYTDLINITGRGSFFWDGTGLDGGFFFFSYSVLRLGRHRSRFMGAGRENPSTHVT